LLWCSILLPFFDVVKQSAVFRSLSLGFYMFLFRSRHGVSMAKDPDEDDAELDDEDDDSFDEDDEFSDNEEN